MSLPAASPASRDTRSSRVIEIADAADVIVAPASIAHSVVALSDDPALLDALSQATGELASVVPSPSADRFIDQLVANTAAVALVDAASAPAPLSRFIDALHHQFPQVPVLLVGPALLQTQFADELTSGVLFRFVHKPASAQRLKLFIETALQRPRVADAGAEPLPSPAASIAPSALRNWIGIAIAALATAAFAVWMLRA